MNNIPEWIKDLVPEVFLESFRLIFPKIIERKFSAKKRNSKKMLKVLIDRNWASMKYLKIFNSSEENLYNINCKINNTLDAKFLISERFSIDSLGPLENSVGQYLVFKNDQGDKELHISLTWYDKNGNSYCYDQTINIS